LEVVSAKADDFVTVGFFFPLVHFKEQDNFQLKVLMKKLKDMLKRLERGTVKERNQCDGNVSRTSDHSHSPRLNA
jgi:hypothetical protein